MQIYIPDLLAQVRFLIDQSDQTVFHLQKNLGAFFNVFGECTRRRDREILAPVVRIRQRRVI